MTEINNLTPQDQKLLEEIEQILINNTDKRREDHSQSGYGEKGQGSSRATDH